MIAIKRVYEPFSRSDGYRVLIDRLWPRGVKREALAFDLWAKAISPSNELRIWFGHRSERWVEFQIRYRLELASPEAAAQFDALRNVASSRKLTLLTATRNETENHAVFLKKLLNQ
jgi:uncharacterized protein YeaO (DUF488 family)